MKIAPAFIALGVLFIAAFTTEPNIARPGGDYASIPDATVENCAAACASDSLCMSWTFDSASSRCDLKAVVPAAIHADGATSGVAPRAPAFARTAAPAPVEAPTPTPPEEHAIAPPAARQAASTEESPDDFGDNLLGGPDADLALRSHLPDDT